MRRRTRSPPIVPAMAPATASAISGPMPASRSASGDDVNGQAGEVDHQGGGRRRGDEPGGRDVEAQERRRSNPALIADEPAEHARQQTRDPRRRAAESHALGQAGQATETSEHQQSAEDDDQAAVLHDLLQQRADQSTRGAHDSERAHDPARRCAARISQSRSAVAAIWGIDTAATASGMSTRSANTGVSTLPMPKPASDAMAPARIDAAAMSRPNTTASCCHNARTFRARTDSAATRREFTEM